MSVSTDISTDIIDKLSRLIPDIVARFPSIQVLYLFGSHAGGAADDRSDVDVAVFTDGGENVAMDLELEVFLQNRLRREVDVVTLQKVSPIVQHEVLKAGKRLFEKDPELRAILEVKSTRAYLDARYYQDIRFGRRGSDGPCSDRDRLLGNLEGYVNDLRTATDITHEKYRKDIRSQRFVERTLQIAIECCFDAVHHIISDEGLRSPTTYADAFTVLAENGIIPWDSIPEYQMMAQFRNKIVHFYEKVDPEMVYGIFKNNLDTFEKFSIQIQKFLKGGEDQDAGQ